MAKTDSDDFRCWICGCCDDTDNLKEHIKNNSRYCYVWSTFTIRGSVVGAVIDGSIGLVVGICTLLGVMTAVYGSVCEAGYFVFKQFEFNYSCYNISEVTPDFIVMHEVLPVTRMIVQTLLIIGGILLAACIACACAFVAVSIIMVFISMCSRTVREKRIVCASSKAWWDQWLRSKNIILLMSLIPVLYAAGVLAQLTGIGHYVLEREDFPTVFLSVQMILVPAYYLIVWLWLFIGLPIAIPMIAMLVVVVTFHAVVCFILLLSNFVNQTVQEWLCRVKDNEGDAESVTHG